MTRTRFMVNEPRASFDAHLFTRKDVEDAGGDGDGDRTSKPVSPLCSRSTSYGPFNPVTVDEVRSNLPGHDGDICGICKNAFRSRETEGDT